MAQNSTESCQDFRRFSSPKGSSCAMAALCQLWSWYRISMLCIKPQYRAMYPIDLNSARPTFLPPPFPPFNLPSSNAPANHSTIWQYMCATRWQHIGPALLWACAGLAPVIDLPTVRLANMRYGTFATVCTDSKPVHKAQD